MRKFRITRTALGLYGALLVLPTLIFAWLYWRELEKNFQSEQRAMPEVAKDRGRKIQGRMQDELDMLMQEESARPFTDYSQFTFPAGTVGDEIRPVLSPLTHLALPRGVQAWFNFDRQAGPDGDVDIFVGQDTFGRAGIPQEFVPVLREFRQRHGENSKLPQANPKTTQEIFSLASVAVQMAPSSEMECVIACLRDMADIVVNARCSEFQLQFYVDDHGLPRLIASRRIQARGPIEELPRNAPCVLPLAKGFDLQQGFLIDTEWFFNKLPWEIAEVLLDEHETLSVASMAEPIEDVERVQAVALIKPVAELGFGLFDDADQNYGQLVLRIDTEDITRRFELQKRQLLAVAVMLVLTLATGMTLLYRSVDRELEQAHRMQNFVAAVTHELRTPVSTIRLHAEMLLDGWATEPDKQMEYYRRIVRETGRLSTLVENVLEKSRLKESATPPIDSDLNEVVTRVGRDLANAVDQKDLVLELAPRLPRVWLTPDGVHGILSNLVENARKYAPMEEGGEPILIRTRWDGQRVLMEVADRGPGIPKEERSQVFEAFYRVGSEATRTATGTGLGLHLVGLHAEASGAKVSIHDRDGGGSIFRTAWRSVPAG